MNKKEIEILYLTDFKKEAIGNGNPYQRCVHCGRSEPEINGNVFNHLDDCEYRVKKLEELNYEENDSTFKRLGGLGKKIKESLNDVTEFALSEFDFVEIEKKLEQIGYKINSIEVTVSVPPRAAFEIDISESKLNETVKKEIVESSGLLLKAIISTLDNALSFQEKIKFKHKNLDKMILDISIIPTVKFVYS